MPLTGLPNQAESTLHTLPDGTSQWQVFPADAATGITPITQWNMTTDEFLRDADTVSIEVTSSLTGRPRRDATGSNIPPIVMTGSSCVLQINGCYKGDYVAADSYNQWDVVLYTDGNYWRSNAVIAAGGADAPGSSTL